MRMKILQKIRHDENVINLQEYKCPLCGKILAGDEYNRAMEKLRKKVAETYDEQTNRTKQEYEQQLQEITRTHKVEIENLKKGSEEQRRTFQKELEQSYKEQIAQLKKTYDQLSEENRTQFNNLKKELHASHKKELQEKEEQLKKIRKDQENLRKLAFEQGVAESQMNIEKLKSNVQERDIQIKRFQEEIDILKKKLTQSQAELKGEAGEIDLYVVLQQEFPDDHFKRQKRGTASGDIIQQIRTATMTLETPIVYDNKQVDTVTKKDIEKAKNYKKIHKTDYVIIVSRNLPKRHVENGLYGEREGILLAHPSIIVEVAKQIRKAIIEICKQTKSTKDREAKESKLYDYIRSQEFARTVGKLFEIYQKMSQLQDREEKAHGRLWKERKILQSKLNQVHVDISNGVDSIIQDTLPLHEFIENHANQQSPEKQPTKLIEPLIAKSRKKKKR
jgi:hypothetical protein